MVDVDVMQEVLKVHGMQKIRSKVTERASFCATLELYSLHTVI